MATRKIFRNKTWNVEWVEPFRGIPKEIKIEYIGSGSIPSHGNNSYAIEHPNGKIAYDYPGIPDYIKNVVEQAFRKRRKKAAKSPASPKDYLQVKHFKRGR